MKMNSESDTAITQHRPFLLPRHIVLSAGILAALYAVSVYNYLLFHVLAELFSIVVAFGIFIVAWNTRRVNENNYLLFLGVAYLFVGGLDLLHTISYKGMGVLQERGPNLPTQLWITARYTESLSLLIAPFYMRRTFRPAAAIAAYSAVSLLFLGAIYSGMFPDCYIEGPGLTAFKKISEYVICMTFIAALVPVYRERGSFDRQVFMAIMLSIVFSAAAELSFTFYVSVYGLSNLTGHYFKLVSFYLIYRALIETGLAQPYNLLFRDLARSEANLRVSEKKYRSLFENMLDGFAYHKIIQDEKGGPSDYVFLEVNGAFERLTGLKREDVVGKRVTEALPGIRESSFDWIGEYGKVALTGRELRTEQYSEQLGKWYSVSAFSPLKGHFVAIFEDITTRKRTEERMEHLASFPQLNPNPVMETDPSGKITYSNPATSQVLEGLGMDKDGTRVFLPDDFDDILLHLEKSPGPAFHREVMIKNMAFSSTVHYAPEFNVVRIYAHDITGRKQAEEERERLLAELKRSNTELEQFAYIASHDLQEPLRMISSYVELIANRYRNKIDDDADEFIEYIINGTSHMKTLLNDLLAYSRVSRQMGTLQATDLNSILDMSIMNLKASIDENHAVITREGLPVVLADRVQMVQIFQNLISNAMKFRSNEPPRIHVSADHDGREWTIRVRDNGIGIDPKYYDKLFILFKRLHSREEYPGTGIGLAVCKKIVERHGGRIWVESEPGNGSTFCFTIKKQTTPSSPP